MQHCHIRRCGIISFVSNLGEFLSTTEIIFRTSDRRTDIEKWYMSIITSIMDNIPRYSWTVGWGRKEKAGKETGKERKEGLLQERASFQLPTKVPDVRRTKSAILRS